MSKGIVAQVGRMLQKEGDLDHHSRLLQNMLNLVHVQNEQIATLKAALIDRDLRLLEECNGECGKNDIQPEDCDRCEQEYVVSQLAREMPEIFGDAK